MSNTTLLKDRRNTNETAWRIENDKKNLFPKMILDLGLLHHVAYSQGEVCLLKIQTLPRIEHEIVVCKAENGAA